MPRHGIGIDISTLAGSEGVVTTIDDFLFESFSAGEMHPIQTASRTNLIPYSEDFSNAAWDKSRITFTSNYATAPDGTQTAYRLVSTGGSYPQFHETLTGLTVGKTYTVSFHVKSDGTTQIQQTAHITSNGGNVNFTPTSDWVRIEYTRVATATSHTFVTYTNSASAAASSYLIWGYQVEEDGFISEYIPTSGSTVTVSTTLSDTSEVWDFDSTDITLEADPEDEGFWEEGSNLVLNHDYEELGSEIINNGTYDADSNWTKGTGWSIANGVASSVDSGNGEDLQQGVGGKITSGKTYKVEYTISNHVTGGVKTFLSGGGAVQGNTNTANGTYTDYLTAPANNTTFKFTTASGGFTGSIDNVSVKQVDPNDRWTFTNSTGWSIEDGKAVCDGSQSSTADLNQSNFISTLKGAQYETTYTISNYSAGTIKIRFSSGNVTTERSSNGTFTEIITAADNGGFRLRASSTFAGSVDNVTLREYAIQPLDI